MDLNREETKPAKAFFHSTYSAGFSHLHLQQVQVWRSPAPVLREAPCGLGVAPSRLISCIILENSTEVGYHLI